MDGDVVLEQLGGHVHGVPFHVVVLQLAQVAQLYRLPEVSKFNARIVLHDEEVGRLDV